MRFKVLNTPENEARLVDLGYKQTLELPGNRFITHKYLVNLGHPYIRGQKEVCHQAGKLSTWEVTDISKVPQCV